MTITDISELIKKNIFGSANWKVSNFDDKIIIDTASITGIRFYIEIKNHIPETYFYHRTSSWDYEGDRSDLHDIIPILLAAFFKCRLDISYAIYDLPHPIIETSCEIYARYIIPQQSDQNIYSSDEDASAVITNLIINLYFFESCFWYMVGCPCENCRKQYEFSPAEYTEEFSNGWPEKIQKALNSKSKKLSLSSRFLPTWDYYRNYSSHVSIIQSPELCIMFQLESEKKNKETKIISGINGDLLIGKHSSNFISYKSRQKMISVLEKLDKIPEKEIKLIQIENVLSAFGTDHIVFIEALGGAYQFNEEKELLRNRYLQESEYLFKPTEFIWAKNIDAIKFEELIKDLLEREQSVTWVRKVSHTNEQDGGRDLIAEWRTPPLLNEVIHEGQSPYKPRKIIIQCKASNSGIGKSQINDIRDTIEHFGYDGYFLAVSSYTKRNLTDALDKIKNDRKYWINWWTRDEIEKRLSKNPDLLKKYNSIVIGKD